VRRQARTEAASVGQDVSLGKGGKIGVVVVGSVVLPFTGVVLGDRVGDADLVLVEDSEGAAMVPDAGVAVGTMGELLGAADARGVTPSVDVGVTPSVDVGVKVTFPRLEVLGDRVGEGEAMPPVASVVVMDVGAEVLVEVPVMVDVTVVDTAEDVPGVVVLVVGVVPARARAPQLVSTVYAEDRGPIAGRTSGP
jgi:hypothetical protein